jgi:spore coat polysaccharide biosynthesis predicted glycosyltransferase SpsG/CMP-N-acetylneuraminic acid synthetase
MSSANLIVLIPALKKTVAFQDDLVKKLAGISLIQRAINKAVNLGIEKSDIHLLTDSEEIRLIAERNGVQAYWDPGLVLGEAVHSVKISGYLKQVTKGNEYTLLLSPYAPLLTTDQINSAVKALRDSKKDLLKPSKKVKRHLYDENNQSTFESLFGDVLETHSIESKAFTLMRTKLLQSSADQKQTVLSWPIDNDLIEIESYQDWWVCEKLLTRKRIVFRVIGNEEVGMGHIYRALALAHEITDHEILFVSDSDNTVAVNKLAGYDYWMGIYEVGMVVENIIKLKPDLVVNDILSTSKMDVLPFQKEGIKVINFEDLGKGAKLADLTINELYDEAQFEGDNILWGHQYFFVRDEFNDAKQHRFKNRVDSILLTFGGTDQHDLTRRTYHAIRELCKSRNIQVHIVVGAGYVNFDQLKAELKDETAVTLTNATGVISYIMEQSHLAIVSNGRTLYELAHMNIPAIVISQHKRENTHSFACEENGFVLIGLFEKEHSKLEITKQLTRLLDDDAYRHQLFERTRKYRFDTNKKKVIQCMLALLAKDT